MEESLFSGKSIKSSRIINTASSFARTNFLFLQEVGSLKSVSPHISARKDLASFLFFIVTDGSGTLTYNGRVYNLKKGDCAFINCKTAYSHCSSEDLWSLSWCHFYGSNALGIYNKYTEHGGEPVFRPKSTDEYLDIFNRLYSLASSSDYIKEIEIYSMLTSLCARIMKDSCSMASSKNIVTTKRDIQEIKNYIDNHYGKNITLESLATDFFISKHYLARCFKEQCGITVTGYIHQVRIEQAKRRLRFTDETIEYIAENCGFSEANYFSRVFKKVEDTSPAQYRKSWKGKF